MNLYLRSLRETNAPTNQPIVLQQHIARVENLP